MKIKAYYLYLLSLIWLGVLAALLRFTHLNVTGLGMTLTVLTLIFLPGIFLWRLIRFENVNLSIKLLYIIGLGFVFYFFLNFLALIFKMTLGQLSFAIGFFSLVLFCLSFWEDRQNLFEIDFIWIKKQTIGDWLLIALLLVGVIAAFLGVDAQSNKVIGDSSFHLAILKKVLTAENLSPHNLWVTKTTSLNLVYSFPVWHIFLGFLSKILNLNTITTYTEVLLPLVVLAIMVVLGFIKAVFQNKYLVIVSFLTFLALSFSAGIFYNLVPLRSPDSLVRLLLFPLVLGLTINYLIDTKPVKSKIFANVFFISFLAISMGLVHFPQLIEYFLILGLFLIFWLIFNRGKEALKKLAWLFLTLAVLILPYLLIFQLMNLRHFFQSNLANFTDDHFRNKSYIVSSNIYLYTVFALPLMALFFKKERRLIFVVAIALGLLMISWQVFQLRLFFLKYFGEVFTIRAITDIPSFLYVGFIIFLLILLLNLCFRKKIFAYLSSSVLIGGFLLILAFRAAPVKNFIDTVIISAKNPFFYDYFVPILIVLVAVSIVIFVYQNFIRKKDLTIQDPPNKINFVVITFILLAILSMPYLSDFRYVLAHNPNGSLINNREIQAVGDIQRVGGKETIDFLQTLPPRAVLITSSITVAQILLPNISQYLAEYPYGINEFSYSQKLYDPNLSPEGRQEILDKHPVDYVICLRSWETVLFEGQTGFEKIYQKKYSYTVQSGQISYQKEAEFTIFSYLH